LDLRLKVRLERGSFYNKGKKRSLASDQKKQKRLLAIFNQKRIIPSLSNAADEEKLSRFPSFFLISFDER